MTDIRDTIPTKPTRLTPAKAKHVNAEALGHDAVANPVEVDELPGYVSPGEQGRKSFVHRTHQGEIRPHTTNPGEVA